MGKGKTVGAAQWQVVLSFTSSAQQRTVTCLTSYLAKRSLSLLEPDVSSSHLIGKTGRLLSQRLRKSKQQLIWLWNKTWKGTWTTYCLRRRRHRHRSPACVEEKETLVRGFRLVPLKAITLSEAQYNLDPGSTYAALLLLVPFATTAPPLAWVPLAPIPKFGSGNSINNTRARRGNV